MSKIAPKFKVGDPVKVVHKGTSASRKLYGQSFLIHEVRFHKDIHDYFVLSKPNCDGLWEDELEYDITYHSPLCQALR